MQWNEVVRVFGGSVTIYVMMAACSARSSPHPIVFEDTGRDAQVFDGADSASSGGGSGDGSGGIADAASGDSIGPTNDGAGGSDAPGALDALMDPVPSADADPNQSGTRLKANYYAGSDGSKQFIGWHDSQLNADCSYAPAADGSLRCMPAHTVTVPPPGQSYGAYYEDSACSQPLAVPSNGNGCPFPPTQYGFETVTVGACNATGSAVYSLQPYTGTVYYNYASVCMTLAQVETYNSPPPVPAAFFTVGSLVPPSTFVAATVQTEP